MLSRLQQGWQQSGWLNLLLLPISLLYGWLMQLRTWLYRCGLLQRFRMSVPVIVIGNLTAGGTGKTPLLIALAQYLAKSGYRPGIVSRGYGGNPPFTPMMVEHDSMASITGDEPLMIHHRTGLPVVIGADRVAGGHMLIDKCQCDVILSDDGFQHLRLERDIDIVVFDGQRGIGNGWCLPSGPMREPVSAIRRADLVVLNGKPEAFDIKQITSELSMVFTIALQGEHLISLDGQKSKTLSDYSGMNVIAMAGLGNPQRFFAALESAGLIVESRSFADHHSFSESDFSDIKVDDIVVMTEKDAVKCRALSLEQDIWVLPIDALLPDDLKTALDKLLNNAKKKP